MSGSKLMPSPSMLTDLFIPTSHKLPIRMDDLRNMYQAFPGTVDRATSSPICGFVHARDFRGFACDRLDLRDDAKVYVCWRGLGMGDHNAVDIAQ